MEKLFITVCNLSMLSSYLILAVIGVRFLVRKAPKNLVCMLWLLVGIRLTVPYSVESVFSLIPNADIIQEDIQYSKEPAIITGITAVDQPVNQYLQEHYKPRAFESVNRMQVVIYVGSCIWIGGMVLMLGFFIFSWQRVRRGVETAIPQVISDTKIYKSEAISAPFLFGIIQPRIYLPNNIADKDISYVIAHERTHRKRKDYLIKPVAYLYLTVYWFHPLVWISYLLLCRDIELACDECVIRELGMESKKDYSRAILSCSAGKRSIAACPVAFGETGVKARVKNILYYKKPGFWLITAVIIIGMIVAMCFMTQKKKPENLEQQSSFVTQKVSGAEKEKAKEESKDVTAAQPKVTVPQPQAEVHYDEEAEIMHLQQFPDSYQELLEYEALIITYQGVEAGEELWETFYERVSQQLPANLDIIQFTVEGDAMITHLAYNGAVFYATEDISRDKFAGEGEKYWKSQYSYLKIFPVTYQDGSSYEYVYLVNDNEITYDEITAYLLSSTIQEPLEFKILFSMPD